MKELLDQYSEDNELSYYTIAFMIKLLGEDAVEDLFKEDKHSLNLLNNYRNLPYKRRLKYETNILSKYARVIRRIREETPHQ